VIGPRSSLDGLRCVVAGAGRVGASVAHWLAATGARVEAVAGRRASESAAALASELGCRLEWLDTLSTPEADLLLLALPDAELAPAAAALAERPQARVVLHVAGALGASVLAPLRAAGSAVGSWHPLRAFPAPAPDPATAADTFFALDGDPPAVELGARLAEAFSGHSAVVPERDRSLYHGIATLAAGGVTTLLASVASLADELGLPSAARRGYLELSRGAVAAASDVREPADAITGPVARGDEETFLRHLEAIGRADPSLLPLVVAVARESLRQLARRGAPSSAQNALARRLEAPDLLDRPKDRVLTSPAKP